ncbi:hypothetical protein ABUL04_20080 [Micromonospora harpali]|uniref:DUF1232 domain-containing protein n=1 Tax=Micromonospora harpali TaxID=1490225 RepID=A0ABW1HMH6_9ACTN
MRTSMVLLLVALAITLITLLVVSIVLFVKLVRVGSLIRSDLMPVKGKVAFWTGVVYALSPLDLLPDPIYLDDIGLLVGVLVYVRHLANQYGIADR